MVSLNSGQVTKFAEHSTNNDTIQIHKKITIILFLQLVTIDKNNGNDYIEQNF